MAIWFKCTWNGGVFSGIRKLSMKQHIVNFHFNFYLHSNDHYLSKYHMSKSCDLPFTKCDNVFITVEVSVYEVLTNLALWCISDWNRILNKKNIRCSSTRLDFCTLSHHMWPWTTKPGGPGFTIRLMVGRELLKMFCRFSSEKQHHPRGAFWAKDYEDKLQSGP